MYSILAVDDEPKNLKLIQGFLGDQYRVTTAQDGVDAWNILESLGGTFDVIVLDRMMPNMDGITLISKIKENPGLRDIPVIMQTAAAQKDQIVEGIKAGVYYYLTKPYDEDVLTSIVASAVDDFHKQKVLGEAIRKHKKVLGLVEECRLSFQTLEEADDITAYLANFFPDPQRRATGISELLVNAVEHGNLGVGYEEKTILKREYRWLEEVRRRQRLPEHAHKFVYVHFKRTPTHATLTVKDDGPGFDWNPYLKIDAIRATDSHGRGIAMAKLISFDNLEYRGSGNEVCAAVNLQNEGAQYATG